MTREIRWLAVRSPLSLLLAHLAITAAGTSVALGEADGFYGRVQVVTIGVNDFREGTIPDLRGAESDAKRINDVFEKHYGYDCKPPLLGEQATREKILKVVAQSLESLEKDDVLILYLATHGQRIESPGSGAAGFIVPQDAALSLDELDLAIWKEQTIPIDELLDPLRNGKNKHVLLILDTCCSGFATHRGNLKNRPDLQLIASLPSRIAIAATSDSKPALESLQQGYGLFTTALVEQLQSPRASSVTEVFEAVRRRVIKDSGRIMNPQMGHFGQGEGEFVFIPKSIPQTEVDKAAQETFKRFAARGARLSSSADVIAAFQATDYRFSAEPTKGETEWKNRLKRFEENAALSDPWALAGLHYCYSKGLGTDRDAKAAYRAASEAFALDTPIGKHVMGRCLLQGIGVERNEVAARRLLGEAAEAGSPISCYSIGLLTLRSKPPATLKPEDVAEVKSLFEKAASGGVAMGKTALAKLAFGDVPYAKRDLPAARQLLTEAEKEGDFEASYGLCVLHSGIIPQSPWVDLPLARRYLETSARAGFSEAQDSLACAYYGHEPTIGYPQDFREARKWFELAAAQGSSKSLLSLAQMYERGEGGPVDFDNARKACEAAAAQNYPRAFVQTGIWRFKGTVYPRDRQLAMQSYRRAADMGDAEACYLLGDMYWNAQGVDQQAMDGLIKNGYSGAKILPPFQPHALYWFIRAEKIGGEPRAKARLDEFARYYRSPLSGLDGRPPVDYEYFGPEDVVTAFRQIYKEGEEYQTLQRRLSTTSR